MPTQTVFWPAAVTNTFTSETKLPVLSPVALRVVQLSDDPLCDSRRLSETVGADPGLSARVLKLANSSYYGYGSQVTYLHQAIALLGYSTIRNVVLGLSMTDLCAKTPSIPYVENFWVDSYLSACLAFAFARTVKYPNPTYAFTAGLLHSVGKLLITGNFPKQTETFTVEPGNKPAVLAAEEAAFGFNHAHAGAWLASQWNFPTVLVEAIGTHYNPTLASEDPLLSSIVGLTDSLVSWEEDLLPEDISIDLFTDGIDKTLLVKLWESWIPQREGHMKTLDFLKLS